MTDESWSVGLDTHTSCPLYHQILPMTEIPWFCPCLLLAAIPVLSRRFHDSQCTTTLHASGLDDMIFPSGVITLVVEGLTFFFDTKNYPITHPWIWRFCTWWTKSCTMNAGKMKTQGLLSYKNHNKTYTLVCLAAALYDGTGHSIYTSNTWRPFLATTLSFPTSGCPWHFMRQRGGAW